MFRKKSLNGSQYRVIGKDFLHKRTSLKVLGVNFKKLIFNKKEEKQAFHHV